MTNSTDDLAIRAAGSGDFEGLRDLYRHLVTDDLPAADALQRQTFAEMMQHPRLTILLAQKDRRLVASCTLVIVPNMTRGCAPYALVENVVTHENWRGLGIGRRLMETALERAFDEGCFKIMLLSGADNTAAHRFYKRLGFANTKTGFELRAPGYPARLTR
ncbi:GNAT family N-acetyltransferase [Roseibium sp. Sym1]|uniref:GNAT family N-acetyltransferase n=1 Tax=Roseibium sp. Sym1 TaxID=3016006 RepID=UPI0022B51492|nr:GNAT family N-acetyltransferase [Roseibium sp. Sym1]